MESYRIRITCCYPFLGTVCQEVSVEEATPMLAAITGLERLAVRSLERVIGIELSVVQQGQVYQERPTERR